MKIKTNDLFFFVAFFNLLISSTQAQQNTPILSDVKRDYRGGADIVTLDAAERYCYNYTASVHRELPTARDLALYAKTFGAADVLETDYPGVSADNPLVRAEVIQKRMQRYYPIYTANQAHQNIVDFYYSTGAYLPPAWFRRTYGLWSQSNYGIYNGLVYLLDIGSGDLYYEDARIPAVVRCKL